MDFKIRPTCSTAFLRQLPKKWGTIWLACSIAQSLDFVPRHWAGNLEKTTLQSRENNMAISRTQHGNLEKTTSCRTSCICGIFLLVSFCGASKKKSQKILENFFCYFESFTKKCCMPSQRSYGQRSYAEWTVVRLINKRSYAESKVVKGRTRSVPHMLIQFSESNFKPNKNMLLLKTDFKSNEIIFYLNKTLFSTISNKK